MSMSMDNERYLDTEAEIIAENETYAVIALRVEKAFFSRHLLLLAALASIIILGEPET